MFPPNSQTVLDRLMALLGDFPDIHGLLIVPRWPRATWWTTLHRLPGLKLVGPLPKESFQCGVSGSPGPVNGRSTMLVFIVSMGKTRNHDVDPATILQPMYAAARTARGGRRLGAERERQMRREGARTLNPERDA